MLLTQTIIREHMSCLYLYYIDKPLNQLQTMKLKFFSTAMTPKVFGASATPW